MLYRDYSRKAGEWLANAKGGRENLEAVAFLKRLNGVCYETHPGIMMIAEESTAWPGVSHPVDARGLGFGFKWNMGFMHDMLKYLAHDPVHRSYCHNEMTFGLVYAFSESFIRCRTMSSSTARARCSPRWAAIHVGLSGQEAVVHGPRVCAPGTSGARRASSTGITSTIPCTSA